MNVVLAQSAMADLIAIGRYIARDSPVRAATFVDELEQKCLELADSPLAFPLLPHRKNIARTRTYAAASMAII